MDQNQNLPSDREWTIEEQEKFFASQDAVTGLPNGSLAGAWVCNGPMFSEVPTLASLQKTLAEYDAKFARPNVIIPSGIHITFIVPPEQGWPIVAHCDLCHKTEIVLSPWAKKPDDGDYFLMNGTCLDEEKHIKHNMYPQTWYPWRKEKL